MTTLSQRCASCLNFSRLLKASYISRQTAKPFVKRVRYYHSDEFHVDYALAFTIVSVSSSRHVCRAPTTFWFHTIRTSPYLTLPLRCVSGPTLGRSICFALNRCSAKNDEQHGLLLSNRSVVICTARASDQTRVSGYSIVPRGRVVSTISACTLLRVII